MKKILFLLLTTEKYKDRRNNILSSWGSDVDLYFYSEHEDSSQKVIKVCNNNNVEEKQLSVFKKIIDDKKNNYDWYFFGDDDTFVNKKLLYEKINDFNDDYIYGSDIFGCWGDLHYPSGGAGFLVSNKIFEKFYENNFYSVNIGDVSFGLNMKDKNINIKNNSLFNSQHYEFYKIEKQDVKNYITFHYINRLDEMIELNEICQKNTII